MVCAILENSFVVCAGIEILVIELVVVGIDRSSFVVCGTSVLVVRSSMLAVTCLECMLVTTIDVAALLGSTWVGMVVVVLGCDLTVLVISVVTNAAF